MHFFSQVAQGRMSEGSNACLCKKGSVKRKGRALQRGL